MRSQGARSLTSKVWMALLFIAMLFLLIAAVGGYAFHWTWTGFQGNTLWDWLKLLLIPVAVATAKLSFKDHPRLWIALASVVMLCLAVLAVGGYFFHWTWTGFQGNTLWDWLVLLLIPVGLLATKLAYNDYQRRKKATQAAQELQKAS
jgi:hypothetical protein